MPRRQNVIAFPSKEPPKPDDGTRRISHMEVVPRKLVFGQPPVSDIIITLECGHGRHLVFRGKEFHVGRDRMQCPECSKAKEGMMPRAQCAGSRLPAAVKLQKNYTGKCSVCGRVFRITQDGRMFNHKEEIDAAKKGDAKDAQEKAGTGGEGQPSRAH